jgi:hypothetical protein
MGTPGNSRRVSLLKFDTKLKELMSKIEVAKREGKLDMLVMTMIAIMVIVTIFLALWTGGLRIALLALLNDPNFTATYGAGIADAMVYLLDLTPLLAAFAGLGALFTLIRAILKNPAGSLGL